MRPIRVDVWSDVQCVWCYIAAPRIEKAVARHPGPIEVVHHSFLLTPDAPLEVDRDAAMRRHAADPERMRRIMAQLRDLAAAEGIAYEPDLTRPTNSHRALELLHEADAVGRRPELARRLSHAYFGEGRHIGLVSELVELAADVGLDPAVAAAALADGRHAAAVDADDARARRLGARGVPFVVVSGTVALAGAQSVEQYAAAFGHAAE